MLVRSSPPQGPAQSRGPTVRRAEWSTQQEGVQHHAQVETTHWSAPQHSYGKVVAGVAMRSNGHAVQARRQVEVLSARAPGITRILKATITTSSTSSSSTSQGHRHFDDLQLSVNPLDIRSQKERTTVGRSGALGSRRPPTRGRPILPDPQEASSGDDRSSLERLTSPSIVANGVSKFSRKSENQISSVDITEVKSDSDKNSVHSDEPKYKVNFPDNESEDNFYDSCPEKDSIFKDESEQLEEWRRSSKIRRSLQFPKRHILGKPLIDMPDNWGSVSRIKKELENFHNLSSKYQNPFKVLEKSTIKEEECENTSTSTIETTENNEDFLIKPSALKTKSFISLETLNEVRVRLKNLETIDKNNTSICEKDDGIDTEEVSPKVEDSSKDANQKSVRSYVYGMEAMLNSLNDSKQNYPGGSNSLESRVSKLSSSTTRSDDWYLRRKSYGFEKVGQRNETFSLANHLKNNIESSTDSGICRSSELVNSVNNSTLYEQKKNASRGTVVNIESSDKRETFEDWLNKNRKTFSSNIQNGANKYKCLQDMTENPEKSESMNGSYSESVSLNIPIKAEESPTEKDNFRQLFHRKLSEGTTLSVESHTPDYSSKQGESQIPSKRHTIAVDGIKEIRDLYEQKNDTISKAFFNGFNGIPKFDDLDDNNEKKNKKVEFCKTEVHFAAESGRVNIVETDGKPPSTNNFRRRRRNSGMPAVKDVDKSKLPITHFGDNLITPTTNGTVEKCVTETVNEPREESTTEQISLSKITQNNLFEETSTVVQINGDLFDGDHPRGILKNKPIKPVPYHLGEDREIKPENDESTEHSNLWGVKLKPVKDSPLWKSSVLLNSENQPDLTIENGKSTECRATYESSTLASVEEVNKINKLSSMNESINNKATEAKGYSTKVNIANGDATVQTIFHPTDKKQFVNSEDCYIGSHQRISNTISTSKCINMYDDKRENVTTKICIDVTQPVDKNNIIQNSKITESSLYALKSTALVKDTVCKKTSARTSISNMVLIEKNDRNQVKTAYKSKLCELRKMYEGREREGSEDSADEEVGRLMGISWSRRRAQRHTNLIANSHHINTHHPSLTGQAAVNKDDSSRPKNAIITNTNFKPSNLSPLLSSPKNYLITERKQNLERSMKSSTTHVDKQAIITVSKSEERKTTDEPKYETSFGDTINTPRALMTGRGSARKLKEHELTYFGVKDVKTNETNVVRNQNIETSHRHKQSSEVINKSQSLNTIQHKYNQDVSKFNAVNKQPQFIITPLKKKEPEIDRFKNDKHIYENVTLQKNTTVSNVKTKHPGESIIEELTKAADEILQALNGFSGDDSQHNSSEDDIRYRNSGGRSLKPLETITEGNASKILENKAVQANLPLKEKKSKHSSLSISQKKTRSSSNSSLDSVTKETVTRSVSNHKPIENGQPEKPQRKKISSVEAVKARRLQRASSRDALLKVYGSSSEDLPGSTEGTLKRKSLRRLKSGEVKKGSNTSLNTHSSISVVDEKESSKYNLKSITSILPEIRHKTAISTIKPISEKTSSKEKSSKSKTSSKDRSRQREKLQEATISSLNRSRLLQREKSRSADTSLERPTSHMKDRIKGKDTASYHGDEIIESNQLKYITVYEMNGHDKGKSSDTQMQSNDIHDSRRKKEPYTYRRERSHDKLSSYFKKDDSKTRPRDSSTHRSEKSHDKHKTKESSKKDRSHVELGSKAEQGKEKSSSRHAVSSQHDRTRTRDSSAHRRERSSDRGNTRHVEEKKHEISKLRKLLGNVKESSSTNDKVRAAGASSSQIRSSTHTRTEHD